MDITTFLISVYCLVDDRIKGQRLRQRGPKPRLTDTDLGLYVYFRRHFCEWFLALRQVDRTTFTRQAANLWCVKRRLWEDLSITVPHDPLISIVDSFPMPVCRFVRANRCRLFAGMAAYGYDEVARQTYYGPKAHVRLCWPGVYEPARFSGV